LTGIRPDMQEECIDYTEKRLAAVKELAKYDKKNQMYPCT